MSETLKIKEVKSGKKNGIEIERITFSDGKIVYKRLDNGAFYPKNISKEYVALIKEHIFRKNGEDEVARIMSERGYNSEKYIKDMQKEWAIGVLKIPFMVLIIGISILMVYFVVYPKITKNGKAEKTSDDNSYEYSKEYVEYQSCMSQIDTSDISYDDSEFWEKYVRRYESINSCYEKYPTIVSLNERKEVEDKIAQYKERANSSNAADLEYRKTEAEIERKYQETIAKNNEKYKKQAEEYEKEFQRKYQERQAEAERLQKESEETTARIKAQEVARKAEEERQQREKEELARKCDEFKATYGDKTAEEIAKEDSSVKGAYNSWQYYVNRVGSSCVGGEVVLTQPQRDKCEAARAPKVAKAEEAFNNYKNILTEKTIYYRNLKNSVCN